jgi:hypothetical protein
MSKMPKCRCLRSSARRTVISDAVHHLNEFEQFMQENGIGIELANTILTCLLFADDIGLFEDVPAKLQQAADVLQKFSTAMNLEVGIGNKKTEYMIIRYATKKVRTYISQ